MGGAWLRGVAFVWVLPILFSSLPPIIYPHLLSFIVPPGAFLLLCIAFLLASKAVMPESGRRADGPSLVHESSASAVPPWEEVSLRHAPVSTMSALINVVMLATLEEVIKTKGPAAAMTMLFEESSLLSRVRVGELSFAIISYRQVRCGSDDFTLDVAAFTSAVRMAREAGVEALWLDAWCYRQEGEYDHASFCAELGAVMRHVGAVIWLPRSRTDALPSYQFRLWCSFEASVVAQRGLPVFVAGQGQARSQVALRYCGQYLPALPNMPPPAELRTMAYLNGGLALLAVLCPVLIPILFALVKGNMLGLLLPQYALEAALARNGRHVLSAMSEGIQRAKSRPPAPAASDSVLLRRLGKMLPWLPAYDRRDALVVRSLLSSLDGGGEKRMSVRRDEDEAICALAASCYTAALMEPSPGDSVGNLDIITWLQAKRITLPLWRPIRLEALRTFGWSMFRGCPNVLVNPTGQLRVATPPTITRTGAGDVLSVWDATAMQPVDELPVLLQVVPTLGFVVTIAVLLVATFVALAVDASSGRQDDRYVLRYTLAVCRATCPFWLVASHLVLLCVFFVPWVLNFPHPVHITSLSSLLGAVGYDAPRELGLWFLTGYVFMSVMSFVIVFLIGTSLFTRPAELLRSKYTIEMAMEAHPGLDAAPLAYSTCLAAIHFLGLAFCAIPAAHATWHMWHCGWQSGAHYVLASPDTKDATVVIFAPRTAGDEAKHELQAQELVELPPELPQELPPELLPAAPIRTDEASLISQASSSPRRDGMKAQISPCVAPVAADSRL